MVRVRSTDYLYVARSNGDPLPDLDTVPKKSIKCQIEEMILSGNRLHDARLAQLNMPDFSEDEVVDQLNEFSSFDEVQDALKKASEAVERAKSRSKAEEADGVNPRASGEQLETLSPSPDSQQADSASETTRK